MCIYTYKYIHMQARYIYIYVSKVWSCMHACEQGARLQCCGRVLLAANHWTDYSIPTADPSSTGTKITLNVPGSVRSLPKSLSSRWVQDTQGKLSLAFTHSSHWQVDSEHTWLSTSLPLFFFSRVWVCDYTPNVCLYNTHPNALKKGNGACTRLHVCGVHDSQLLSQDNPKISSFKTRMLGAHMWLSETDFPN